VADAIGFVEDSDVKAEYTALVTDAAGGDRAAMERLLVRAQETAYRFSLLVCGHPEDAEDVMQESLLKTYQHVKRISDPQSFRTWLYTTVRNACLMKRRRHVGEPAAFVSLEDESGLADRALAGLADQSRRPDEHVISNWMDERLRTH
jgi:RNA polymerase sigma-70 factor (ECF subfamily)